MQALVATIRGSKQILRTIAEANWLAANEYTPKPFPGRMALIRCREKSFFDGPDDYLGWGGLAEGGIAVFDAPGDHHTLMSEPNVGELGRILCRCLHSAV